MIQEYLFISDEYKDEIQTWSREKEVELIIEDIQNSKCWIVKINIPGDSMKTANKLSIIDKEIMERYKPIVLTNNCSAYFNKRLFPLVNEFERKLRKLLYLASALQKNDISENNIKDLEEQNLGNIFEMLFADIQFVKNVRDKIKKMSWFTQAEILSVINGIPENTLWDKLLGKDCVNTLRCNFLEVKNNRNDVMHAHNISVENYKKARKLFENVNAELDSAIGKYVETIEDGEMFETEIIDFNVTLSEALKTMQESLQETQEQLSQLSNKQFIVSPEFRTVIDQLDKLKTVQIEMPLAIQELDKIVENFDSHKIEIPPAVYNLQKMFSSFANALEEKVLKDTIGGKK